MPPHTDSTDQSRASPAGGFTLVELLVVVAMVALLAVLLVAAIAKSREAARQSQCKSNLRNIGTGMFKHSLRVSDGRFCSGAYDFRRDGCPDVHGWVADQVNVGDAGRGELLDPASPLRANKQILQLLSSDPVHEDNNDTTDIDLQHGICGLANWKGIGGRSTTAFFAGTTVDSEERIELVSRYFLSQGFTNNYCCNWQLVRGSIRTQWTSGELVAANASHIWKAKIGTLGPLSSSTVEASRVSSSSIGFVGCAAPGDLDDAYVPVTIGHDASGVWANGANETVIHADAGTILAEGYSDGPLYWDESDLSLKKMPRLARLKAQIDCERGKPTIAGCPAPTGVSPSSGNGNYRLDTFDWYAMHSGTMNMLMADGSVKVFHDVNNDYFFNPGFPVGTQPDTVGLVDDTVDLPAHRFFSGIFLSDSYFKGFFE